MEELRRSRRAPKKQTSEFSVGDVVQIQRNNVSLRAVLAQLLTEGSSVHPRWLIKFEGPYKDEEVYEHTFSKVGGDRRSSESSSGEGEAPPTESAIITNRGNASLKRKGASASPPLEKLAGLSEIGTEQPSDDNSKEAKISQESSPIASDSSVPETAEARRKKASAREQRSRRRQAIIDEFGVPLPMEEGSTGVKRKLPPHKPFKNKRPKPSGDEKCLQIKLLTGTLYMYRGPNRRAEFIRKA